MTSTRNENGPHEQHVEPTYDDFVRHVRGQLDDAAVAKNYSTNGADGTNTLYTAVQQMTGGHHHGCAEIVYKVNRFLSAGQRGNNVEDIVKVASWAFLIWRHWHLDQAHGTEK